MSSGVFFDFLLPLLLDGRAVLEAGAAVFGVPFGCCSPPPKGVRDTDGKGLGAVESVSVAVGESRWFPTVRLSLPWRGGFGGFFLGRKLSMLQSDSASRIID